MFAFVRNLKSNPSSLARKISGVAGTRRSSIKGLPGEEGRKEGRKERAVFAMLRFSLGVSPHLVY